MMLQEIFNRRFNKVAVLAAAYSLAAVQVAQAADNGMGLIPCDGDDCTLNSVLQLANNLMGFFFKTVLPIILVVTIVYVGYSYITAGGNPSKRVKIGRLALNIVLGLLIMLCAWVVVQTILSVLGYHDDLFFFGK